MPSGPVTKHVHAVALLLLFTLGVNYQLILGRMPFQDDAGRETIPQMQYYGTQLHQGRIPLWNNDLGSGYYAHATGQSAMLYPLNLFLYRVFNWATAYRLSLILHSFGVALFAYLLAIALGLEIWPAFFFSLCMAGGGVLSAHQIHLNIILALSHCFCMIWLATRWMRSDHQWPWALAGGLALGLAFLGGQPQYVWLAALTIITFAIAAHRTAQASFCGLRTFLARFALVAVTGIALGAVQLIPQFLYARMFPRPEPAGHYAFITAGSFQWADFARFILPGAGLKADLGMTYWETLGFIGIAAIMLAALSMFSRSPWNLRKRFGVSLAAVGTLLMLGSSTPLYHLLAHVPPFSVFRVPGRNVLLVSLGIAVLAADYLQQLSADHRPRKRYIAAVSAAAALLVIAVHFGHSGLPGASLELLLTAAAIMAIQYALIHPTKSGASRNVIVISATAAQLMLLWIMLNPTVPLTFWTQPPAAAQLCSARSAFPGEKVACLEAGQPAWPSDASAPADWRDRLAANASAMFDVPSALVGEPIIPAGTLYTKNHLIEKSRDGRELADFATRLGVRWITMPPAPLPAPWFNPDDTMPYLWENPECVGSYFTSDEVIYNTQGHPRPAELDAGGYDLTPVPCQILGPGEIALAVNSPRDTHLFVMQGYYPGWMVTIDGQPARVDIASPGFFLHLQIPAGQHDVHMLFTPWDYDIGLAVTIAAAVIMLLAFGLWLSARRRTASHLSAQHKPL